MKYIKIKDFAVLVTRDIEIVDKTLGVTVDGAKDGATFNIQSESDSFGYSIKSEKTSIPLSALKEGVYQVNISWYETITDEGGNYVDEVYHNVLGNPIKVYLDENSKVCVIPAPLSTATELDLMWKAIGGVLETIVPMIEEIKHGYEVI